MTKNPLLCIKDLHIKIAGHCQILKGLNLTVNSGETDAIMGSNGSGKSTLAYAIAGKSGYEIQEGAILLQARALLNFHLMNGRAWVFSWPFNIGGNRGCE